MLLPSAKPNVVEAIDILDHYGTFCEVMYLVMAADRRVLNVEREVLRGALDVLSGGRVRTVHMEAMLDASARRVADQGAQVCLDAAIDLLRDDPVRAETTMVLAHVVAAADGLVTAEEQHILDELARGFEMDSERVATLLESLNEKLAT